MERYDFNNNVHLGGTRFFSNTSKEFYDVERGETGYGTNPVIAENKIGLMYVSDYGFAAEPSSWSTNLNTYYRVADSNWMYMGLTDWTITPSSLNAYSVFFLVTNGNLSYNSAFNSSSIRPVFYLMSNVKLESGSGTQTNPYRISL